MYMYIHINQLMKLTRHRATIQIHITHCILKLLGFSIKPKGYKLSEKLENTITGRLLWKV